MLATHAFPTRHVTPTVALTVSPQQPKCVHHSPLVVIEACIHSVLENTTQPALYATHTVVCDGALECSSSMLSDQQHKPCKDFPCQGSVHILSQHNELLGSLSSTQSMESPSNTHHPKHQPDDPQPLCASQSACSMPQASLAVAVSVGYPTQSSGPQCLYLTKQLLPCNTG